MGGAAGEPAACWPRCRPALFPSPGKERPCVLVNELLRDATARHYTAQLPLPARTPRLIASSCLPDRCRSPSRTLRSPAASQTEAAVRRWYRSRPTAVECRSLRRACGLETAETELDAGRRGASDLITNRMVASRWRRHAHLRRSPSADLPRCFIRNGTHACVANIARRKRPPGPPRFRRFLEFANARELNPSP